MKSRSKKEREENNWSWRSMFVIVISIIALVAALSALMAIDEMRGHWKCVDYSEPTCGYFEKYGNRFLDLPDNIIDLTCQKIAGRRGAKKVIVLYECCYNTPEDCIEKAWTRTKRKVCIEGAECIEVWK